jgi:hypothetical protein
VGVELEQALCSPKHSAPSRMSRQARSRKTP